MAYIAEGLPELRVLARRDLGKSACRFERPLVQLGSLVIGEDLAALASRPRVST